MTHLRVGFLALILGSVLSVASSRAATLVTSAGTGCIEVGPGQFTLVNGNSCLITLFANLAGGTDEASALSAEIGFEDPDGVIENILASDITFGGPTWGTPVANSGPDGFSVSLLSANASGLRQYAQLVILAESAGTGSFALSLDDFALGRDIDDPPFIEAVPFTPAIGSKLINVTVVPEPSTLGLLACALTALGVWRRRS